MLEQLKPNLEEVGISHLRNIVQKEQGTFSCKKAITGELMVELNNRREFEKVELFLLAKLRRGGVTFLQW